MSFSQFFINRPIFAGVISIIITLAGLIASQVLPVAQYPEIAPPTVVINASYPGASAETLTRTVAAPIEEQLSGVENLSYFSSTASTNGALSIFCTFEVGSNADKAVIDVNNRVTIALPRLPDVVRQSGVVAQKRSTDILLVISLTSVDPRYDTLYLSNYATINLLDELKRSPPRTTSTRAARSAPSPRLPDSRSCTPWLHAAGSRSPRISATSCCVRAGRAGRCASAMSPASSWVR